MIEPGIMSVAIETDQCSLIKFDEALNKWPVDWIPYNIIWFNSSIDVEKIRKKHPSKCVCKVCVIGECKDVIYRAV